jgi:hypothetical protein
MAEPHLSLVRVPCRADLAGTPQRLRTDRAVALATDATAGTTRPNDHVRRGCASLTLVTLLLDISVDPRRFPHPDGRVPRVVTSWRLT